MTPLGSTGMAADSGGSPDDPRSALEGLARNRDYYESLSPGRESYWRWMAGPRHRAKVLSRIVASLRPRAVIDLGCGPGLLVAELHAQRIATQLVGLDLSQRQVAANRARWPEIEWIAADLTQPIAAGSPLLGRFDVVLAAELVEHLDRPEDLLRRADQLVSPAGRLVISTQSGPVRETERRVGHIRHFSVGEMSELLRANGWLPERVWNTGFPFHDLSKWYANLRPDASMRRFGEKRYGARERAVAAALRFLFAFNSSRRGAQLFAVARKSEPERTPS